MALDAPISIRVFDSADEALLQTRSQQTGCGTTSWKYSAVGTPEVMAGNVLVAEGKGGPE